MAEIIKALLTAGTIPAGSPLPSERVLCERYGVSRMTYALPQTVFSIGCKFPLKDNTETPDAQAIVCDLPSYQRICDARMRTGLGPNVWPHGGCFRGAAAALTVDNRGWEVVFEPSKARFSIRRNANSKELNGDPTRAHVREFPKCVRSRRTPSIVLEPNHLATMAAHLGNIALRTQSRLEWNSEEEHFQGHAQANALPRREYSAPWVLLVS